MSSDDASSVARPIADSASAEVRTSLRYRVTSASLAFVTWGSWAYFVNSQAHVAGKASPLVSAIIHGAGSCMVTLIMMQSVTWLYQKFQHHRFRLFIPAAITTSVTASCMTTAHYLAETANLPATIIPGVVVAFCFNVVTAMNLQQRQTRAASNS
ncbi:MAG: hypothetical protein WAO83_07380 [Fuerstiella sp.]